MLFPSQCTLVNNTRFFLLFYICHLRKYWEMNNGLPGLPNSDVVNHFSIQQVDADQPNEEKRLLEEQLLSIVGGWSL